jgi:amidophosphoribosyltransferase
MRTFIADDADRDDLVAHVYDSTYEVIEKNVDTIVVIDDSIVRGTTLEKSILTILSRLEPKKIVIVSSAPQIRYPDCYGIDMSKMHEFVAFRALIQLIKERELEDKLEEVYEKCKQAIETNENVNYVKQLYKMFTVDEISKKIADIVRPSILKSELEIVYQTIENLHNAIPNHLGDWYFTGDFPTPGGHRVVNKAFVNYMEGKKVRAY